MISSSHHIYLPPPNEGLCVRYDDDHVVAVDKPAGLLSVAGRGADKADCMYARVRHDYPSARVVHRLDMYTSGIMLFPLTRLARQSLQQQFETRSIEKIYYAVVDGVMDEVAGEINVPMRCDWPNRPRQIVDYDQGRTARTNYEVIAQASHHTLVKLTPKTGRSHQLRVHMAHLGYPIVGDRLYNENTRTSAPLLLHAAEIGIAHPETNKRIVINAPAPPHFGTWRTAMR